jgi:ribonuclease HI
MIDNTLMPKVELYTDGACSGNPGPGGYGIFLKYGDYQKELSGAYELTTNNRMELMAVIKGLRALKKPCEVTLYTDSKYIVDALTLGWLEKWKHNQWIKGDKEPVKNVDLWKAVVEQCSIHRIKWIWVKGHDNNKYNILCDKLATTAIQNSPREVDLQKETTLFSDL